ncbi:P13 [Agrotis ipsilon multiple nucleopolyhedrovirus]|uniref:p13 n=1 Tax=Agrotis ipsilon multiple nucleopolyhedrovirus TaxID=208013 RepID=B6D5Y4_9ABAC|nr:P13 [Agrotis ipsilon multiple nucleopolyhedrovirus]ACI28772.1 P13 [Agrotis ipsilon multiple nucleopolyhedrovirus]
MFAYVTLVMLGDEYVEGAMVLAKSLLASGTRHHLVCMVTPDVSARARDKLAELYTSVLDVDYLSFECPPMLTKRQNQMYGHWIDKAFTKWQCLKLHQYEKLVYLDADHLVVKNIDHLFQLKAPGICFTDDNYGYYDRLQYGDTIQPETMAAYMRYNKILCKAGTVLLEPNLTLYHTIVNLLHPQNKYLMKSYYHNGFDEQVLLQALIHLGVAVTQLSVLYVWNAGSYYRLRKGHDPYVINYYGDVKPWHFTRGRYVNYMDVFIWKYFEGINVLRSL